MNSKFKDFDWHDLYEAGSMINPKFYLHRFTILEVANLFNETKEEYPDWTGDEIASYVEAQLVPPIPEKLPWKEFMFMQFGVYVK